MFKPNVLLHLGKQHLCCVTQYREIKCIVFDAQNTAWIVSTKGLEKCCDSLELFQNVTPFWME